MAKRTCVFCGGAPVTGAHLLSKRLRKMLPPVHAGSQWSGTSMQPDGALTDFDRRYSANPMDRTVNDVCGPCNREWMAQQEALTATNIAAMARGQVLSLDLAARRDLAVWFSTFMLLRSLLEPGASAFDHDDFVRARSTSEPLENYWFWLVHADPCPRFVIDRFQTGQLLDGRTIAVALLWIGEVAIIGVAPELAALMTERFAERRRSVVQMHPTFNDVDWPLRDRVPASSVHGLVNLA